MVFFATWNLIDAVSIGSSKLIEFAFEGGNAHSKYSLVILLALLANTSIVDYFTVCWQY